MKNFEPEKVILFGSRAIGTANQDSDYDLCILKSNLLHKREVAQAIYKALLQIPIPIDITLETPENFASLQKNPFLIYGSIAENGEILYEK